MPKRKQKILVTGGAGYIGSHTIIELIDAGYDVVSIDNFSNSTKDTFTRIKKITDVSVRNYTDDVADTTLLDRVFKKEKYIDGIIHFAALKSVPESVADPIRYYENNVGSLLSIISFAKKHNITQFVFSSSAAVYGDITKLPVNETTPLAPPASPYGATKIMGEIVLRDIACAHPEIKIAMLRYFNPIGAHTSGMLGELPLGAPANLAPVIIEAASGVRKSVQVFGDNYKTRDGTCIRDYIHVSDIARAHALALRFLQRQKSYCEVFNLGSGRGVTVLELIHAFEKVTGILVPLTIGKRRAGDIPAIYSECRKAKKMLGWTPQCSIQEAMKSAWEWHLNLVNNKHPKRPLK